MNRTVPPEEAVAILRRMLDAPDELRAVGEACEYGPRPWLLAWRGEEAEVTLSFAGGLIAEVSAVRVGERYGHAEAWDDNPWDELRDHESQMFQLAFSPTSGR